MSTAPSAQASPSELAPPHAHEVLPAPGATATLIGDLRELFKVKVIKVNTLNVRGKARRKRTLQAGKAPDWKKAIVTLKEGDKIVLT